MLSMKANANRKHTKLDNKAFILFVLLPCPTFLPFNFKKQFSLTREVNMKIKEFNGEKVGFKAVHTENDADIL